MPVYDYKCQQHGLFHELASTTESHLPQACPHCGTPSARVIMIAPEVLRKDVASARHEASQHTAVLSTPESRQEDLARREHKHGKGCGCGSKPIRASKLFYTAEGNKMFPSMRPWMISH